MQFYYLDHNNQQNGPFSKDQLKAVGIKPDTWVWTEGLDSWKAAKEVDLLRDFFIQVPSAQHTVLTVEPAADTVEATVDDNTPIDKVQSLAKNGNKNAMYEMAWRIELMPAADRNNPVENCAWQDYWFEKAADAGHVDARSTYARSLIDRVMNKDDREKAMHYFESLAADFDTGKLNKEQAFEGIVAKMWLGVMLCESYYIDRVPQDVQRGRELILAAYFISKKFPKEFDGFGFKAMLKIGEIFATGMAQFEEEPTIADLEKAVEYFEMAKERFVKHEDDPNNRGYLQLVKEQRENCAKRIDAKKAKIDAQEKIQSAIEGRQVRIAEDTKFVGAKQRREKMMEISAMARQRMDADKAALARLRERLKREGW